MSRFVEIFVPVPQEYMGIVIGARGRNINQIKRETDARIDSCNGDDFGRESGFTVTGSAAGCEAARQAIRFCVDNAKITIKEPVSQSFARLLIGKYSSNNFQGIERECGVKITWPKFSGTEKHVIVDIIGLRQNCERAREMLKTNQKKWENDEVCRKPVSPMTSGFQTYSKANNDVRMIDVPKEYINFVVGKGRKNIEKIETKSGTKIIVPPRRNSEGMLIIIPL
ncbi:vigilin isoform X1 [Paramuricea clavata]|uniref:Vigilin isoform X1 n=1 Tax=Paramuricea clavata TaxID=317549 RepID=A0A7D9JFE5_PARCT|nr:vigilin isoform X1 [Paramuricea clavata]